MKQEIFGHIVDKFINICSFIRTSTKQIAFRLLQEISEFSIDLFNFSGKFIKNNIFRLGVDFDID